MKDQTVSGSDYDIDPLEAAAGLPARTSFISPRRLTFGLVHTLDLLVSLVINPLLGRLLGHARQLPARMLNFALRCKEFDKLQLPAAHGSPSRATSIHGPGKSPMILSPVTSTQAWRASGEWRCWCGRTAITTA